MKRSMRFGWAAWFALGLGATPALADRVTATVTLDSDVAVYYTLTGQSANFSTRTSSGASGGLLDGVQGSGAVITFDEVFPEASLQDYLHFGYFGRVIVDVTDPNADPNAPDPNLPGDPNQTFDPNYPGDPNNPVDPRISMVMAFQPGEGVGLRIGDYFPGRKEGHLVAALEQFDSQQFLDILGTIGGVPETRGWIELPGVRAGETLDLVAFIGGPDGDLGVKIGEFSYSIARDEGDVDGDNDVDIDDLLGLLGSFGKCTGEDGFLAGADLSNNGCVDLDDLLELLANFGN